MARYSSLPSQIHHVVVTFSLVISSVKRLADIDVDGSEVWLQNSPNSSIGGRYNSSNTSIPSFGNAVLMPACWWESVGATSNP
jgi:hypothetical protein